MIWKERKVNTTLFIKKFKHGILLFKIYVDDIIFGTKNETLCKDISNIVQKNFEVSKMGELHNFLDLQIHQGKE